jgi:hypothetical protein
VDRERCGRGNLKAFGGGIRRVFWVQNCSAAEPQDGDGEEVGEFGNAINVGIIHVECYPG